MNNLHPTFASILAAVAPPCPLDAIIDGIQRDRRPLPTHDLNGANFYRWAAAVVRAEVAHAQSDFWRLANASPAAGLFDKWDRPRAFEGYRLHHEVLAAKAANVLGHLIGHECAIDTAIQHLRLQRKASADGSQSAAYRASWARAADDTAADLHTARKRRQLVWRIFLMCMADYRAAKGEV